ncbi:MULTISPECIES: polysaccharide biosynthesis protein [Clostridium]|uniref:polysaccharide biosynthesis protein n=1 Tax=Clostridium TaxID=1485 RepID=UPI00069F6934|nr:MULTISPECIES: nucleoside-diphosphate sugar epimerase/dehydratase [Clostridium]KOF55966.1 nucleoside-diphosphate sugar epimerase [Clostridium sp. DMHC 10]MCD2345369.1 polysaccharide biosynthesis protein [Clostridium guangxiense]
MRKENRFFVISDIIMVTMSLYIALLLKYDFMVDTRYIKLFKVSIVPVIVFMIIFNRIFNLYNNMWKYASIDELLSIVYSVSLTNIVFIVYSYILSHMKITQTVFYRFPYTVHVIFWMLCIILLGGTRFAYRASYESKKNRECISENRIRLLIIGAGDAAATLIKEIKRSKKLNYDIIGLIDDDDEKLGRLIYGVKVVGTRNDIEKFCEENSIGEIIVAMPSAPEKDRKEIFNICKNTKCKLRTFPSISDIIDGKFNMRKIRDVSIEDLLGRDEVKLNTENIEKYIKGKNILVTGGGGSIGSELCRQISKFNPATLVILDIYENNAYDLQMELNYTCPKLNKEVIIASIRDKKRLDEIFEKFKPDVVFHAAAHKHVPLMEVNPMEAIKNNVLGTFNVLKCCDEYNVKKFVQISTDKAVNPTNIMGATKRFCELMVQAFDRVSKTEFVAVRFGNVLGSNGSVIPLFKKQIAHGGPVTVTHPEINRFFMTIPEAAQLVIQAGAMAKGGEIFVLDMGKPVKIVDLAKDLITLSGFNPGEDIKIEFTGLRPGEKLYEELLMSEVALTSTEHEKIHVEKPMDIDMNFIESSIEDFKEVLKENNKEKIYEIMAEKVPTYKRKKNQ